MQDTLNTGAIDVRKHARIAAQNAAAYYSENIVKTESSRAGAFALYTWGALAIVSALSAASLGLFSEVSPGTPPDKRIIIAEIQPFPDKDTPDVANPARLPPPLSLNARATAAAPSGIDDRSTGSVLDDTKISIDTRPATTGLSLGAEVGKSDDISLLFAHYFALKHRAPDLFEGLAPRFRGETGRDKGLVSLVAGPFENKKQLAGFCRSVKLRLTIDCVESPYAGEPVE